MVRWCNRIMQPVGGDLPGGLMVQGGSQGSPVCSAMSEAWEAAGSLDQKASTEQGTGRCGTEWSPRAFWSSDTYPY
jgi:hypothetical protein